MVELYSKCRKKFIKFKKYIYIKKKKKKKKLKK